MHKLSREVSPEEILQAHKKRGEETQKTVKCKRCSAEFLYSQFVSNNPDTCKTCDNMNSIAFWYPRLDRERFPMPKTEIIHSNLEDSEDPERGMESPAYDRLLVSIKASGKRLGYPLFLKTEKTAFKHAWKETCFISSEDKVEGNLKSILDESELHGVSHYFFAVREMLEVEPVFTHFYGDMPITQEVRIFVNNGEVRCIHPYWDREAFKDDKGNLEVSEKKLDKLELFTDWDAKRTYKMALFVASLFSGAWSVDLLKTKSGAWFLTDMAIAENSYHAKHEKE